MAHKICVYNKKGGVGKTTISANLAAAIASVRGNDGIPKYQVLLVDCDPQGNASSQLLAGKDQRQGDDVGKHFGALIRGGDIRENLVTYNHPELVPSNRRGEGIFLKKRWAGYFEDGAEKVEEVMCKMVTEHNFKILPAFEDMEFEQAPMPGTPFGDRYHKVLEVTGFEVLDNRIDEDVLRAALPIDFLHTSIAPIENKFDFIIFDCPPAWDRFAKMAAYTSEQSIIPMKPGQFELYGVAKVFDQLTSLEAQYKRKPNLIFAILGMVRGSVGKDFDYGDRVEKILLKVTGQKLVSKVIIPMSVDVMNAQIDEMTFSFGGTKYKDMAVTFKDLFNEILTKLDQY